MSKNKKSTVATDFTRSDIVNFLDKELKTSLIRDSSCNGLQVEGTETVKKIGFAVDGCLEAYTCAVKEGCQMLVVHHGIIWDGIKAVRGPVREQLKYLIDNDLNLYASHLPLDLHPEYGNNACLANMLDLTKLKPFGLYNGVEIGFKGILKSPVTLDTLVNTLCSNLDTQCTVLPFGKKEISTVAIVSGGGGGELTEAISKKVDCYITGESVHHNYHAALEGKINVIYAGHYHTEKAGVQALAKLCSETFNTESVFIDLPSII